MRTWFFVRHLPLEQQRPGARYEVQLLDRDGRAMAEAQYDAETSVSIEGVSVPETVLAAGRAQPLGLGDYVDEDGVRTAPF